VSYIPKANKELGQHFLISEKVITSICNDFAEDCDVIVEVGPGPAVLTQHLAKIGKEFFVIEKDKRFEPLLKEHVKEDHIFMADALDFNWSKFVSDFGFKDKKIWLVSNLPYNVGTVLFTNFLGIKEIEFMTLMFQKEVGDKTYLRQEKNQMNGLLFLSLNYFNSKKLIKVSPGCFNPPPKVESVVVSYSRKSSPDVGTESYKKLNTFTRSLFNFKRKQIGSVLKKSYSKEQIDNAIEKSGLDSKLRAESLDFKSVLNLFLNLNS
jgi:16S rRNA (adenine1518-N6/adenine1519-N6)-dimethyltransferase